MNKLLKAVAVSLVVVFSAWMSGCSGKDDPFNAVEQLDKEVAAIDNYLESNSIEHLKDVSGIRIVPITIGNKLPALGLSEVNVTYKGTLFPSNTEFEQGVAAGFLNKFIPGWQIGIRMLPVGSHAQFYIPSYYGYGNNSTSKVPANSTLVFDVTVNSTKNSSIYEEQFINDTTAIRNYLVSKGFNAMKDPTGVFYVPQVEGVGVTPSWYDQVKMKYTFILLSKDSQSIGTYERDVSSSFSSFVVDYLQAIQVGLMKMKPGGKMRLFAPSGLAFGIDNGKNSAGEIVIPANSNLIIDVELLEVK